MGLENRHYYRDDQQYSAFGGSFGASATRSIVVTIILINVAIFVLDMFSPRVHPFLKADGRVVYQVTEQETDTAVNAPGAEPVHWLGYQLALKPDLLSRPWNFWQLLTHGFTHASIDANLFHIIGNMLVLFFLGRQVEQRLGSSEFLKFYLIAIVVAGIGYVVVQLVTGRGGFVVGASGAVSAVVALFIFMYPKATVLLMFVIPMPAWVLGVLVVAMDVMNSLDPNSHIATEAHFAGAAFGVAYFMLKWNFGWLRFDTLKKKLKSKPNLKVHKPDADSRLQKQADEILQKIADHGEESLTNKERKILNKYSKTVRSKRD